MSDPICHLWQRIIVCCLLQKEKYASPFACMRILSECQREYCAYVGMVIGSVAFSHAYISTIFHLIKSNLPEADEIVIILLSL